MVSLLRRLLIFTTPRIPLLPPEEARSRVEVLLDLGGNPRHFEERDFELLVLLAQLWSTRDPNFDGQARRYLSEAGIHDMFASVLNILLETSPKEG